MKYEEALKELEEIISKLNDNKIPMSEASKIFERGVELSKFCFNELNNVKGKVTIVREELGKLLEENDENF